MNEMSRYVGWDEAVSKRVNEVAAQEDLQLFSDVLEPFTQTISSSTPVNKVAINMAIINNSAKARSRGLNGDTLFNLPEDPLSAPLEARRKKIIKKSAVSKKRPSRLPHPWPKLPGKKLSQLHTPPNSSKRQSKHLPIQTELFSGVCHTKPLIDPPRLITTEAILKAGHASLGQTTMEKLASFRHKPSTQLSPDINLREALGVADGREKTHGICRSEISIDVGVHCQAADSYNPTGYKDHAYVVIEGHGPAELSTYNNYDDFEDAAMLEYDGDLITMEEGETNPSKRLHLLAKERDSEDEYPLDDGLANEMIELPMPDQSQDIFCRNSSQHPHENKDLDRGDIYHIAYQKFNKPSCTHICDGDSTMNTRSNSEAATTSEFDLDTIASLVDESIDWPSVLEQEYSRSNIPNSVTVPTNPNEILNKNVHFIELDDYSPLKPFARPPFPFKVLDRSPIIGVSSQVILRTCFRTGEALQQGALCEGLGQDAIIELFARVMVSSHYISSSKIYFEFADIFHDRPPFVCGILDNSKATCLQDTESRMLLGVNGPPPMARCLGRLERVTLGPPRWKLHIINIRPTDWEEVRWTKQIAGAGMVK